MDDPQLTRLQLDSRALQVLAHPLRSRILTALRQGGPANATRLAAQLSTNTGATSYHLRKLADVDLVVEASADNGDAPRGKERWWKAATDMHGWAERDIAGDPDGEAASQWLRRHYFQHFSEEYARWLDQSGSWSVAWRDAAGASDRTLALSPEQLTALEADILEVLGRYQEPDAASGSDVRRVRFQMHSYPTEAV